MKTVIMGMSTTIGGCLGWFLGEPTGILKLLIVLVIIDYISGVMIAIINKELSSTVGFKGICKKILMFSIVGVGNLIDVHVIKDGNVMRTAAIGLYISNEGLSVIENFGILGVPLPKKIKIIFKQLNNEEDA